MSMDERIANNCANLDMLTYTDSQKIDYNNDSIESILPYTYSDDVKNEYQALSEAVANDSNFAGMQIVAQSHFDQPSGGFAYSGNDCTCDPIQAYALKDAEGNLYICYRGTGDGRWYDDGQGLYDPNGTDMQEAAKDFADECIQKYGDGHNIYITGHSKGGNEAQYVTLTSQYADKITACYSFDGQGFSEEFYEKYKDNQNLSKMYSINGDNDPVHRLGYVLIPSDNTYYLNTRISGAAWCHDLTCIISNGQLNWKRDSNGNIIQGEPGLLTKYAEIINKNLNGLPPERRKQCINALMGTLDIITNGGSLDGESLKLSDLFGFGVDGFEVILFSLKQLVVEEVFEKFGIEGVLGVVVMAAGMHIGMFDVLNYEVAQKIIKECDRIIRQSKIFIQNAQVWAQNFYNNICNYLKGAKEWFFTHYPGYSFASENPYIQVDTDSMRFIAACLNNVRDRAKDLDWRMNSLYFEMGINWDTIGNLANLLKVGIGLDYADRLGLCANYLNETADEFESVESQLVH